MADRPVTGLRLVLAWIGMALACWALVAVILYGLWQLSGWIVLIWTGVTG